VRLREWNIYGEKKIDEWEEERVKDFYMIS
jgi:hypothetical protein